jgi:hypothetical protein
MWFWERFLVDWSCSALIKLHRSYTRLCWVWEIFEVECSLVNCKFQLSISLDYVFIWYMIKIWKICENLFAFMKNLFTKCSLIVIESACEWLPAIVDFYWNHIGKFIQNLNTYIMNLKYKANGPSKWTLICQFSSTLVCYYPCFIREIPSLSCMVAESPEKINLH